MLLNSRLENDRRPAGLHVTCLAARDYFLLPLWILMGVCNEEVRITANNQKNFNQATGFLKFQFLVRLLVCELLSVCQQHHIVRGKMTSSVVTIDMDDSGK